MIYGFGSPEEIIEEVKRRQLENESLKNEIYQWIDSLEPRSIALLQTLVLIAKSDSDFASCIVGELRSILRCVHHVDPETGLPYTESLGKPQ